MAGNASNDSGVGRSLEGFSSGQHCQNGEALAEWRSCEQVDNGTPSTSPPYWDIDDDDDSGAKPSQLYGRYTWKIEKFSQTGKKELKSDVFEVGSYKWYILIYPQGCDVCNHLSLFLCVANHDKLRPGWSHFAQFTIAVVNEDPKKSKYSDTLHRFCKKEHDWGWKKFMELSKVQDGFIVSDTLEIRAQVQIIRDKERPFRCLDRQYRRELVRVYLTNVEQVFRSFFESQRDELRKLIDDKVKWLSFCTFWVGVDQNTRHHMSREKTGVILKDVVKQFFIDKEVTSTLAMDSVNSGLKALEAESKRRKGKLDSVETSALIVRVEDNMFVLANDVLSLLDRISLEPSPSKDDKGSHNRTKDGNPGGDYNKDSIERDERLLTELGRRVVEIFALNHIFRQKIYVAHQMAVALKRQEELIREEEAAGLAEIEQKAKRRVAEKEKRSKKKMNKQKRSSRKGKDRGKDDKCEAPVQDTHQRDSFSNGRIVENSSVRTTQTIPMKPTALEDVFEVSDTEDDVSEPLQFDTEDRGAVPVFSDTDTSEIHLSNETFTSRMNGVTVQNGHVEKNPSLMDDSSSTCSTDSVPSVVMIGNCKGNSLTDCKNSKSRSRGNNQRGRGRREQTNGSVENNSVQLQPNPAMNVGLQNGGPKSSYAAEFHLKTVLALGGHVQKFKQHLVEKEEVVSLPKKLVVKEQVNVDKLSKQMTVTEVSLKNPAITIQPKFVSSGPILVQESLKLSQTNQKSIEAKQEVKKNPIKNLSTDSSFPRTSTPMVSLSKTTPWSMDSAQTLDPDLSPATNSFPRSYKNTVPGLLSSSTPSHPFLGCSQPSSSTSGFTFGSVTPGVLQNQPVWKETPQDDTSQKLESYNSTIDELCQPSESTRISLDEFPHLDIINSLFDDELGNGMEVSNGYFHTLPLVNDMYMEAGSTINNYYHDQMIQPVYGSYNGLTELGLPVYGNGVTQNQWPVGFSSNVCVASDGYPYHVAEYPNMVCSMDGYTVLEPSNGH